MIFLNKIELFYIDIEQVQRLDDYYNDKGLALPNLTLTLNKTHGKCPPYFQSNRKTEGVVWPHRREDVPIAHWKSKAQGEHQTNETPSQRPFHPQPQPDAYAPLHVSRSLHVTDPSDITAF